MQDYTWPNLSEEQQANLVLEAQRFSNNTKWKEFARGTVLQNVFTILDESRKELEESDSWGHIIGDFKSLRWQHFVLDVMQKAFELDYFVEADGTYNNFKNTEKYNDRMLDVASGLLASASVEIFRLNGDVDKWRKAHNKI